MDYRQSAGKEIKDSGDGSESDGDSGDEGSIHPQQFQAQTPWVLERVDPCIAGCNLVLLRWSVHISLRTRHHRI